MASAASLAQLELERRSRQARESGNAQTWKQGDRSLFLAYVLAAAGGWLGLHHLYLDRPIQALLWACSPCLGGFFSIGLVLDFWKLPGYMSVRTATLEAAEHLTAEMKHRKVPPWRSSRTIGALCFGLWFAKVGSLLGPSSLPPDSHYFDLTGSLAAALGIWLVGSACTHQGGSLKATCAASLAGLCLGYPVSAGVVGFQWTRRWEPEQTKRRPKHWQVVLAVWMFWSLALLGFLEHGHIAIDTPQGRKYFVFRECIGNILRGIEFKDFQYSFNEGSYEKDWRQSWEKRWEIFRNSLDVQGERRALKTLEMEDFIGRAYAEADVKLNYKKMAKLWHPDRAGLDKKHEAEEKMQEINAAKEVLDKITGHSRSEL
ncbi:unnamed protein product [Polarella glacialis]|uniref:DnaJ homolog subfamily C member 22 n=1 Tax=Polarella glacialis TaxID=89957 RepID=A0A813EIN6_POLGL|nr:unnamed protein product [Polarella glacialis]